MIHKYVGEKVILLPAIPVEDRDAYAYEWSYKHRVFPEAYEASIVFERPLVHRIVLKVTHKRSGLSSTFSILVEVTHKPRMNVFINPKVGNKSPGLHPDLSEKRLP